METGEDIRLGSCRLLRRDDGTLWELGRGARDVTYKAFDGRLERPVALRHLPDEYAAVPGARDAFVEQAKRTAQIQHPNVAALLELSPVGGPTFCTLEYVGDETVESLVHRAGAFDSERALLVTSQAARALQEIWQRRLVATDLAPARVALAHRGEEVVVQLRDLHLVPEEAALDIRANIRALGGILRFMLAGAGDDPSRLQRAPQNTTRLLEAMLAANPRGQIQSPFDLARRIRECRHGLFPAVAPPAAAAPRLAQRFTLKDPVEGGDGHHFEADDRLEGGEAIVHVFRADEPEGDVRRALAAAELTAAHPHPHVLRAIEAHSEGEHRHVAYERAHGFRVLDLLRRRRQLPLPEALMLAAQMAAALDHAIAHEMTDLDFRLAAARVAFPPSVPAARFEGLAAAPLTQWPAFAVKIPAFGSYPQTRAPEGAAATSPEARLALHLRPFAEAIHELLGGSPLRAAAAGGKYAPVASLSESGNRRLKQILTSEPGPLPPSAGAFVTELRASLKTTERSAATAKTEPPPPYATSAPDSGRPPAEPARPPRVARRALLLLLGLAAALGVAFLALKFSPKPPEGREVAPPAPAAVPKRPASPPGDR